MNTMDLEVQKAGLAQAILVENDETVIKNLWLVLKERKPFIAHPKTAAGKRNIGVLEGKISFREVGNGKITIEEFLGL
jgi:hypothetical protein